MVLLLNSRHLSWGFYRFVRCRVDWNVKRSAEFVLEQSLNTGNSISRMSKSLLIHALNVHVSVSSSFMWELSNRGRKNVISAAGSHTSSSLSHGYRKRRPAPTPTHISPVQWALEKPGCLIFRSTAWAVLFETKELLDGCYSNWCWGGRSEMMNVEQTDEKEDKKARSGNGSRLGHEQGWQWQMQGWFPHWLARAGRPREGVQRGERGDPMPVCILPLSCPSQPRNTEGQQWVNNTSPQPFPSLRLYYFVFSHDSSVVCWRCILLTMTMKLMVLGKTETSVWYFRCKTVRGGKQKPLTQWISRNGNGCSLSINTYRMQVHRKI